MADEAKQTVLCQACGFHVGLDPNGLIQKHISGGSTEPCVGSGKVPGKEVEEPETKAEEQEEAIAAAQKEAEKKQAAEEKKTEEEIKEINASGNEKHKPAKHK